MRVKAQFEHGSTYVDGAEIYFYNHLSPEIPDAIANELLKRPGYTKMGDVIPIVINRVAPTTLAEIKKIFFNDKENHFIEDNSNFNLCNGYFTYTMAKHRDSVKVSIVIPTRNRYKLICDCIRSIYEHTYGVSYEIVLVDGSDGIETFREFLFHAGVFIVRELVGNGTITAFNRGFKNCAGEYVVWLNDDLIVEKNWLKIALEFMENNLDVSMGAIYHKEGALGNHKPTKGYIWEGDHCVRTLAPWSKHSGHVYANFGILKNSVLEEMDYWDNVHYKSYVGDTDLTHRMLAKGWKVSPIPGCRVIHTYQLDDLRALNSLVYKKEREYYETVWSKK